VLVERKKKPTKKETKPTMNSKYKDFSGGNLLNNSYSYERPAYIVANALVNGFLAYGLTEKQALNLLYSKAYRAKLDWDLEDKLEKVAFKAGKQVAEEYAKLAKVNPENYGFLDDPLDAQTEKELDKLIALYRQQD
jgi:hypothetical protein